MGSLPFKESRIAAVTLSETFREVALGREGGNFRAQLSAGTPSMIILSRRPQYSPDCSGTKVNGTFLSAEKISRSERTEEVASTLRKVCDSRRVEGEAEARRQSPRPPT